MAISISPSSFFHRTPELENEALLEIHVLLENGCCVDGAKVVLYENELDLETKSNPVSTEFTNNEGFVLFNNLRNRDYYFFIQKGDYNNSKGILKTWVPLEPRMKAMLSVKIL
ncbi:MAG: hypothetical protein PHP33_06730 [Bacteroidales bacterium]|nr:hypothetical protein [Bacteroidales bacterium]